ncbi:MAG TPA: hypothetical protein VE549_17290 [Myxococcaceae bacterium]|nr:hypothetical protein [Myxococcaceae bacterium]
MFLLKFVPNFRSNNVSLVSLDKALRGEPAEVARIALHGRRRRNRMARHRVPRARRVPR